MVAHHHVLTLLHWHHKWQHELGTLAPLLPPFSLQKSSIFQDPSITRSPIWHFLGTPCGFKTEARVFSTKTFWQTSPPQQLRSANIRLNKSHTHTQKKKNAKCLSASGTGTTRTVTENTRIWDCFKAYRAPPTVLTPRLHLPSFWLCDLFSNSLQGYQESRLVPRSRRHAVKWVVRFFEPKSGFFG